MSQRNPDNQEAIDGTCIRDYVDVRDFALAFLAAADHTDVFATESDRRAGDPAFLCADVSLIKDSIGFVVKYSLEASTESLF